LRPDVIVSQPAFETADHAQPLDTVTTILPAPPSASTATVVGETTGVHVGVDEGGLGVETGGSSGGAVGPGVVPGDVGDEGGTDAAGVPVCTIVTDVPLIDTVAMRGSLPGFEAAVATTAPAPWPSAGAT
jgi:hypothetical protein